MLEGKKIILGVTGSIAAYKAAILIRLLVKKQCQVQVLMTKYAKEFITPLTLATLSKRPILVDFFNPENGDWNSHVDMGLWADALIIAPASANTIAKMANGIADNLLLTTYLSARCPVFVAPAMDIDMLGHPATQKNIRLLSERGNYIIEPASGDLASGLTGKGRMDEPDAIIEHLENFFSQKDSKKKLLNKLSGKKILVNAGPTYEDIDPVRFIGNHSSGKMGYAIAKQLASYNAEVILVSGPVSLPKPHPAVHLIDVTSADEMFKECYLHFPKCDGAVLAAAVADFKPVQKKENKIKSKDSSITLELTPTRDIASELGKIKINSQFLVGFALESENELENSKEKLLKKKFDFIVLNSIRDEGAGFKTDTNKITILDKHNNLTKFELKSKEDVAEDILLKLIELL